jgi:hypothetical protein
MIYLDQDERFSRKEPKGLKYLFKRKYSLGLESEVNDAELI